MMELLPHFLFFFMIKGGFPKVVPADVFTSDFLKK